MINEFIIIFFLSSIPALISYLADYTFGFPGKDQPNTKAIFFSWSLLLAKHRLMRLGEYEQLLTNLEGITDQQLIRATIFLEGRRGFSWEQAIGMCVYCTNFWLAFLFSFLYVFTIHLQHIPGIFLFILVPIISHFILRKI